MSLQFVINYLFSSLPNLIFFLYRELVEILDVSAFLFKYSQSLGFWVVVKYTWTLMPMKSKNQLTV